jgi:hypothetical protein
MGAYDLDREQILNPNSKLHNLFGGTLHSPKKKSTIEEEQLDEKDSKFNFSESETEQNKASDDFVPDNRPFADMYSASTTVDYLINKRKSPTRQAAIPASGSSPKQQQSPHAKEPSGHMTALEQKVYLRVQNVGQTIEEEMDKQNKPTNDKVEYLRAMKKTPLQRVLAETNVGDKFEVNREILDYDKQFFLRQLARITKSYQSEIKTQQMKAKEKAIEYVERNMFLAKEALQKELAVIMKQYEEAKAEVEGTRDKLLGLTKKVKDQEKLIAALKTYGVSTLM